MLILYHAGIITETIESGEGIAPSPDLLSQRLVYLSSFRVCDNWLLLKHIATALQL